MTSLDWVIDNSIEWNTSQRQFKCNGREGDEGKTYDDCEICDSGKGHC